MRRVRDGSSIGNLLIPELGVEGGFTVAGLVRRGGPRRSDVAVSVRFVRFGVLFGVTTTG